MCTPIEVGKNYSQTIKKQGSGCVLARMNRRGVRGRAQRLMLNCSDVGMLQCLDAWMLGCLDAGWSSDVGCSDARILGCLDALMLDAGQSSDVECLYVA